eukprot:symbB.v1.2.000158.t1/scaffold9.1/size550961/14
MLDAVEACWYYLRTKAAADAIKFTVEVKQKANASDSEETVLETLESQAIEALNSEKPKYACVNCSA